MRPLWHNLLNTYPCPANPETTEDLLRGLCKGEGTVVERYADRNPRVGVLEVPGVMAAALERAPYAQDNRHTKFPLTRCRIVRMRRRHVINMISLMLRRGFPHTTELNIEYVLLSLQLSFKDLRGYLIHQIRTYGGPRKS